MEYKILKFELGHEGRQNICTYIEILDDDVVEPDEFFSVQLFSTDPTVTLTRDRATIRIIDDDGDQVLPTENSTPTNCACPTASATPGPTSRVPTSRPTTPAPGPTAGPISPNPGTTT